MKKSKFLWGIAMLFLLLFAHSAIQAMTSIDYYYIEKIYPETIGNKGKVNLNVVGHLTGAESGSTLTCNPKIWGSYPSQYEIPGTIVKLTPNAYFPPNGGTPLDVLTVAFDFPDEGIPVNEMGYGGYVQLSDCNASGIVGSGQVKIAEATNRELWVSIAGLTTVRFGAKTDYTIWYGNSGNNNINAAVLFLAVPKFVNNGDPVHTLGFNLNDYKLEPYNPANLNLNWGDVSQSMDLEIDSQNYTVYQLLIRDIPPFSFNPLKVTITWGNTSNDYLLKAWWAGGKPVSFHPIWPEN